MRQFKAPRPARVNMQRLAEQIEHVVEDKGFLGTLETPDEVIIYTERDVDETQQTAVQTLVAEHDPDDLTEQQQKLRRLDVARERMLAMNPRQIRDQVNAISNLAQARQALILIFSILHDILLTLELTEDELNDSV